MKKALVLLMVLILVAGFAWATESGESEGNVLVKLDLLDEGTTVNQKITLGFSKNEVNSFDDVNDKYSDGLPLTPDSSNGTASNGNNKIYAYAQIVSKTPVDVYLRSSMLDGYNNEGTVVSGAGLSWTVTADENFSVTFDSDDDVTSAALLSHKQPGGTDNKPISDVYCKELTIVTTDFRGISSKYGVNSWKDNLVITVTPANT